MAKKQLTISQKKNRARLFQRLTFGGEYVALSTPFVAMGIVNRETWFYHENGWKTGIGFVLACILFTIIVTSITFESEKLNNRKGKYIKLLIGCLLSAFIFVLLSDIMSEIANILFAACGGIAAALGLDITSLDFKNKADAYGDIIRKAKEKVAQEQVEEEIRQDSKDVKF